MGLINKYSWMRWRESFWEPLGDLLRKPLVLAELCRSSPKARMITLVGVAFLLLVIYILGVLFTPRPKTAISTAFVIKQADAAGVNWTLNFIPGQNFKALSDSQNKPGPPLTLGADIQRNNNYVSVQFYLVGAAGEKYVPSALRNNYWPEPPTVIIKNSKGGIVTQQKLKFGGHGVIPLYWKIPNGFHGQVCFELDAEFGPFEIHRPPITMSL